MTYCEDAPCCGCCGTNLYGSNESRPYDDAPDVDDFYDREEDESEDEDDDEGESFDGMEDQWLDGSYEE